jgi:hypothetical protein
MSNVIIDIFNHYYQTYLDILEDRECINTNGQFPL